MNTRTFDTLTRRASLLTLGTAGLAALATRVTPLAADARNKNKNKNRKKKKEKGISLQQCRKQVGPCTTLVTASCNQSEDCLRSVPCCELLGRCDGVGFVSCVIEAQAAPSTS